MNKGYAICLNEWSLDKDIKNELGLLLIISSLCAKDGYCYASNKYLGDLFNIPEQTISRKLKKLEQKKYITIEYKKRGCEVIERNIRLTKMLTDDKQKCEPTINKNVKENNISNNIININNKNNNNKEKYFDNKELNNLFIEFLELRKKIKCKNTDRAITLLLNELNKYDDDIKIQMLNNSIMNSWKSVYPVKNKELPKWFDKEQKIEETKKEDKEELDKILKELENA